MIHAVTSPAIIRHQRCGAVDQFPKGADVDLQQAQEKVEQIVGQVSGEMGVVAWPLDNPEQRIAVNAGEIYPMASTFKVPVLYSLYRMVDQGEVDPEQRITIEPKHLTPGSGVLQHLRPGLEPTIWDLAVLMTIVSDNEATDILHNMVGAERIDRDMKALDLNEIEAPASCKVLLYTMVGMDPENPEHTYTMFRERARAKEFDRSGAAFQDTLGSGNDVSTPQDLAQLYVHIYNGDGLSDDSRDAVIDILKRQTLNSRIPTGLPDGVDVAHKTGSLEGVRNDAGIVYAEQPYVISILSKQLTDGKAAVDAMIEVSSTVWETFGDDRE